MKENGLEKKVNKDLILREKLAIERTNMANDSTLLAFIRTSLYFAIAGLTITEVVEIRHETTIKTVSWVLSITLLVVGIAKYIQQKKRIQESKKHIGNYQLEYEEEGK